MWINNIQGKTLLYSLKTKFLDTSHEMCPISHPYAFSRGSRCCANNVEDTDVATYGERCDGGDISIFSECCKDGNEISCTSRMNDCIDQGNTLLSHNKEKTIYALP